MCQREELQQHVYINYISYSDWKDLIKIPRINSLGIIISEQFRTYYEYITQNPHFSISCCMLLQLYIDKKPRYRIRYAVHMKKICSNNMKAVVQNTSRKESICFCEFLITYRLFHSNLIEYQIFLGDEVLIHPTISLIQVLV